jgi:hypothetical protein
MSGGKMKTANQLTIPQFEALIERVVERKLLELFGDPDRGLVLRTSVKTKLRRSYSAVQHGERGISAAQVAKELGLKW